VPPVTFSDVYCYLIVTPVDFPGEKLKAYNFVISGWVKSLQVLKRNSVYHSSDVYSTTSFVLKSGQARASIRSRTVWVAVQTDGTMLLSADMTVPYGIISLSVCDCQRYMKCMNVVVYLVHFKNKNMTYLDSNFDGIDAFLMRN